MATKIIDRTARRFRRHNRVRARVAGTVARPRLAVFRSTSHINAQLIDDENGNTLAQASDKDVKKVKATKDASLGVAVAAAVGAEIAKRAKEKGILTVVFDRGGFTYHGRVKALADAARKGGLTF